jgi:hypothetical protein
MYNEVLKVEECDARVPWAGPKPHKMNKSNVRQQNSSLIILKTKDAIGRYNSRLYSASKCLYARVVAAKVASHKGDTFPFSSIVLA